jgi:aminomethyltransferase
MLQGYDALRESAAWFDLSGRGEIIATGRDRARLLHSITTNHIKDLAPGEGCYAFVLTPQGRIQADLNVFCEAERFLLDTEPETRARLLSFIGKYIIADDVTLEDISDALCVIAVEGPQAADVLAGAGAPAPEPMWTHAVWNGATVARASATGQPGWRIMAPAEGKQNLIGMLETAGALAAADEAVRTVRLEHGKPRYGDDIFDTTLPQESQQTQALHFNKGCYLGQEIVERVRARGHVNRLLVRLLVDAAEAPAPGTKLSAHGAEVGEITSAAFSPALAKVVALAYVRAGEARPGAELSAAGRPAVVA